jgi:hypothetical protein
MIVKINFERAILLNLFTGSAGFVTLLKENFDK